MGERMRYPHVRLDFLRVPHYIAPPMRTHFALALCLMVGCDEEAIDHPPPPPTTPVRELAAAATQPILPTVASSTVAPTGPTGTVASAPAATLKKMTLEAFMDDYIEPATRKAVKSKKASPELEALLRQLGGMFPDELKALAVGGKKPWDQIVEASLTVPKGVPKYGLVCKQCHAAWKKPYKKAFRKREVDVALPPSE